MGCRSLLTFVFHTVRTTSPCSLLFLSTLIKRKVKHFLGNNGKTYSVGSNG